MITAENDTETTTADLATQYARRVIAGQIVVNKWMRLACERHLRDLERDDLVWDYSAFVRYQKTCDNLEAVLSHAGQPFELIDWQCFVSASLLCWRFKATGHLRYTLAVVRIARKNGKSTWCGTLAVDDLVQGEGKRVYIVANTIDQGEAIYTTTGTMLRRHRNLGADAVKVGERKIKFPFRDNECRRVAAKEKTLDSLNPSRWFGDEAAEWRGRFATKLITSTDSREDAFGLVISTPSEEGTDGFFDDLCDDGERILEREYDDDARFFFLCGIDEEDDPGDESCWPKANPSIGKTITIEKLRAKYETMRKRPITLNEWIRFHCARQACTTATWLDMTEAKAMGGPLPPLLGRDCCGGLDLAKSGDMASLVLAFKVMIEIPKPAILVDGMELFEQGTITREGVALLGWHWYPISLMKAREDETGIPLRKWNSEGTIIGIPGKTIELDFIREQVKLVKQAYGLKLLAFDRWGSKYLAEQMIKVDEIPLIQHGQGMQDMAPACAEFRRWWTPGLVRHGDSPVLLLALKQGAVKRDQMGNEKLVKRSKKHLIDPLLASVMAVHCLSLAPAEASPYGEGAYI